MSVFRDKIEQLVQKHGSQAKLAEAIGCSQQQISYLMGAKSISAAMAKRLDEFTDGEISRHELRPDIFDPPDGVQAGAA